MRKILTQSEQEVADNLLEKGLYLVKYNRDNEDRYAIYNKDPNYRENLVNDNVLWDTEGKLSDFLFELKMFFRVDFSNGNSDDSVE
jgi:hypothetical protein